MSKLKHLIRYLLAFGVLIIYCLLYKAASGSFEIIAISLMLLLISKANTIIKNHLISMIIQNIDSSLLLKKMAEANGLLELAEYYQKQHNNSNESLESAKNSAFPSSLADTILSYIASIGLVLGLLQLL